jgi:hypothetical protein
MKQIKREIISYEGVDCGSCFQTMQDFPKIFIITDEKRENFFKITHSQVYIPYINSPADLAALLDNENIETIVTKNLPRWEPVTRITKSVTKTDPIRIEFSSVFIYFEDRGGKDKRIVFGGEKIPVIFKNCKIGSGKFSTMDKIRQMTWTQINGTSV